jgi:hypothetical protein
MNDSNSLLITSRSEFQAALKEAFAIVADSDVSEIWLCDENFADWPLNEPEVVSMLARWSLSHRRCHVLALDFSVLQQRHPRWVQWRRDRAHVVHCMTPDEAGSARVPSLLFAPGAVSVRLSDRIHYRGRLTTAADDAVRMREEVSALFQRGVEAFPASTLGL